MDLFDSFCYCIYFDNQKKYQQMKKYVDALLPLIGTLLMCIGGCVHQSSPITVAPAVDSISKVQGNLSAVDAKAVVVESWLKSH